MTYALLVGGTKEAVDVRLLEWHAGPGDALSPGDLIVELETHKVIVEVRAGQAGVLRSILCKEGEWRKLGDPLAILSDEAGSAIPASAEGLAEWDARFELA
jgi:pyruvate/2-oxoglutarate dehydrogenase complex dihydrolipoamide acyltransferase (E2) component